MHVPPCNIPFQEGSMALSVKSVAKCGGRDNRNTGFSQHAKPLCLGVLVESKREKTEISGNHVIIGSVDGESGWKKMCANPF